MAITPLTSCRTPGVQFTVPISAALSTEWTDRERKTPQSHGVWYPPALRARVPDDQALPRGLHCGLRNLPQAGKYLRRRRSPPSQTWRTFLYLMRDRDAIFGGAVVALAKSMGIEEVVAAPRSPWQNPYVEHLIGSIRREC